LFNWNILSVLTQNDQFMEVTEYLKAATFFKIILTQEYPGRTGPKKGKAIPIKDRMK